MKKDFEDTFSYELSMLRGAKREGEFKEAIDHIIDLLQKVYEAK